MIVTCLDPLASQPFILAAWIFLLVTIFPPQPPSCAAVPSPDSLATVELHYEVPAAAEVEFVWGINGWQPVTEEIRPQGTTLRTTVMSTRMTRSDNDFIVTILTEIGAIVDYGFLITKTAGGAPVEIWDEDTSYHFTVKGSDTLHLKSKKMYQIFHLLADRGGITFFLLVAVFFAGLAIACAVLMKWDGERVPNDPRWQASDTRFAVAVSLSAGVLGLLVIVNHELWRDELQAWRIATNSETIGELLSNARYEGHPAIWYLTLYLVGKLSQDPIAMQLVHILLATGATFVFCNYAPFSRWQKISLCFGYFLFFEYFIVSRNYAFGVLALWGFCALRARDPRRVLTSTAVLGFLANTSAFGAILAVSLGAWLLIETFSRGQEVSALKRMGLVSILAFAVLLAGIQSAPPADNSPRILAWNTSIVGTSLEKTLASVWRSYAPLPVGIPHFWNTNVLDELPPVNVGNLTLEPRDIEALLSLILIGISVLALLRTPTVMLTYMFTTFALLCFLHSKVNHGIRHPGHLFLLLVACLWLSRASNSVKLKFSPRKLTSTYITTVFFTQLVAGVLCSSTDLIYPFTASKAAAKYIEEHFTDTMMVGSNWNLVSGVACYLNRPMYYVENGQTGTFSVWNKKRLKLSPPEVIEKARHLHDATNRDVLLILSFDPGTLADGLQQLASFERSVLKEERFWLYLLSNKSRKENREANPKSPTSGL